MEATTKVRTWREAAVLVVAIDRPEVANAVDAETATELHRTFDAFDDDPDCAVAVLTGSGDNFCAGADLKMVAVEEPRITVDGRGPMGPTRLRLGKPVIAAIEGYAVAGGLELALWCDLRVAGESATLGVFCRRLGVPLVDGGTVRLPRLIGHSRAMDLILTGRGVGAGEAAEMGLVNRVVPDGAALSAAITLAKELAELPQTCMRNDRLSVIDQWGRGEDEALAVETAYGIATLASGEAAEGARRFVAGEGRHGEPV